MRKFKITVEGIAYEVTVEELESETTPISDERAPTMVSSVATAATGIPPPESAPESAPAVDSEPGDVSSPLSGTITAVEVSTGQSVKSGDTLLRLEAMKMESAVVAPHDGTVGKIRVSAGQLVQEGQILLTIN